jgi:hypothetical protein
MIKWVEKSLPCIVIFITLSQTQVPPNPELNAFCSDFPSVYPFPGGIELDGSYSLIRHSFNQVWSNEGPPHCGRLTIETVQDTRYDNEKTLTSTRLHPFAENGSLFTKTFGSHQLSKDISPGRWKSDSSFFQFVRGPLTEMKSVMFLNYDTETYLGPIRSFLYAQCAMEWRGIMDPSRPIISEWGIAVRSGHEQHYHHNNTHLAWVYDKVLERAKLAPVRNMTVTNYFQCD